MGYHHIDRVGLGNLLTCIDAGHVENGKTFFLTRTDVNRWDIRIPPSMKLQDSISEAVSSLVSSATGLIIYDSGYRRQIGDFTFPIIIEPPFPVKETRVVQGWDTSDLRRMHSANHVLGIILLRLGKYSIGIYRGQTLLSSKIGSRYVKGRHKAGGQSQTRFRRIRDKQIHQIYDKVCLATLAQFSEINDPIDYIFLGGDKIIIKAFLKKCYYLETKKDLIVNKNLDVRQPSINGLRSAIHEVWRSAVITIP